jgi:hypothetical protein
MTDSAIDSQSATDSNARQAGELPQNYLSEEKIEIGTGGGVAVRTSRCPDHSAKCDAMFAKPGRARRSERTIGKDNE